MEQKPEKPKNGTFNIDMRGNVCLVTRYLEFGENSVSFSVVVEHARQKTPLELHIESAKAVISYLQGLVDRSEERLQTAP